MAKIKATRQPGKYHHDKAKARPQIRADEDELLRRAVAAYVRSGDGELVDQPAPARSGIAEHDGKEYLVLRNARRTLAVYRVRAYDGVLKRLRRWPEQIEEVSS